MKETSRRRSTSRVARLTEHASSIRSTPVPSSVPPSQSDGHGAQGFARATHSSGRGDFPEDGFGLIEKGKARGARSRDPDESRHLTTVTRLAPSKRLLSIHGWATHPALRCACADLRGPGGRGHAINEWGHVFRVRREIGSIAGATPRSDRCTNDSDEPGQTEEASHWSLLRERVQLGRGEWP